MVLILGDGVVEKTSLVEIVKSDLHLENIYKEQEAIFKAAVSGESTNEPQDLYLRTEFFNSGSVNLDQVEIDYFGTRGIQ